MAAGTKPVALELTAATDGGYVVHSGDGALYAGSLDECLRYMRGFFEGKPATGGKNVVTLTPKDH